MGGKGCQRDDARVRAGLRPLQDAAGAPQLGSTRRGLPHSMWAAGGRGPWRSPAGARHWTASQVRRSRRGPGRAPRREGHAADELTSQKTHFCACRGRGRPWCAPCGGADVQSRHAGFRRLDGAPTAVRSDSSVVTSSREGMGFVTARVRARGDETARAVGVTREEAVFWRSTPRHGRAYKGGCGARPALDQGGVDDDGGISGSLPYGAGVGNGRVQSRRRPVTGRPINAARETRRACRGKGSIEARGARGRKQRHQGRMARRARDQGRKEKLGGTARKRARHVYLSRPGSSAGARRALPTGPRPGWGASVTRGPSAPTGRRQPAGAGGGRCSGVATGREVQGGGVQALAAHHIRLVPVVQH